ncbi:MAG: hypothetical protein PHQ72_09575 [Hespellia sp.]|nr:hypothetical protein [Hespellia sp.]
MTKKILEKYLNGYIEKGGMLRFEAILLLAVALLVPDSKTIWFTIFNIALCVCFTLYARIQYRRKREIIFLHIGVIGIQIQLTWGVCCLGVLKNMLTVNVFIYASVCYALLVLLCDVMWCIWTRKKLISDSLSHKKDKLVLSKHKKLSVAAIIPWIVIVRLIMTGVKNDNMILALVCILFMTSGCLFFVLVANIVYYSEYKAINKPRDAYNKI